MFGHHITALEHPGVPPLLLTQKLWNAHLVHPPTCHQQQGSQWQSGGILKTAGTQHGKIKPPTQP